MGVTKDEKDIFVQGYVSDDFDPLQYSPDEESDDNAHIQSQRNAAKNRTRQKCILFHREPQVNLRKRCGAKQARRTENLRQLMTLAEKDELGEVEISTVFEPSMSAFAGLFMEREKMKIWNDFINSSEEEQNHILEAAGHVHTSRCRPMTSDEDKTEDMSDTWEEIPDKRAGHPGYSAEACYNRIDRKLRLIFKRRHLPVGLLATLEEDIVSFFKEWPCSVYVSKLTSSFERMMVHALCQYLDLHSQSYDDSGERRTQVENKKDYFEVPSQLLTEYLQEKRGS
ncbi:R3H domain-containing protein 4-like [Gigantopelta aegis]|uniref:R3H domain-containing protein 4-like n=1 Tax=Gigantopelta aegis TaxID=1735272 RepID=UPI001B88C9AE|nr:R3H domain-containing protein 4-like [Gigantopelta aegis]